MNKLYSAEPWWQPQGLALVRMIVGSFMIWHGIELFNPELMKGYLDWDQFRNYAAGKWLVYGGKAVELLSGILLLLGWFTRIGAILLILSMGYISFFVGRGRVWYEEQHPFLLLLLGCVFLFCGPGSWSIDRRRGRG